MTTENFMQGYPPSLKIGHGNPEALKYGRMWERAEYRKIAPGEFYAQDFLLFAKPRQGAHVIDFGCGTGRGGAMLRAAGKLKVTMIDFVNNCLDPAVRNMLDDNFSFVKADLEKPLPMVAEYGFCTDVMEHIPPDKVDIVLNNILKAAQDVWFTIALFEDACGKLIEEDLHLSVHPFEWWEQKFKERDCQIFHSQNQDNMSGHFYVRAWQDGKAIVDHGILNVEQKLIVENVRHNIAQDWQQIQPHESNHLECMILGGGPSLDLFEQEIKKNRVDGTRLLTLNGSYNWAINHGLIPSAQVIVDARPFNARFTKPVVDDCKYLIASQCHPSVFDGLPKDRTYIWHTTAPELDDILREKYGNHWWAVPGGSTVLLRAIPMMRMLGYQRFILYGCDSCIVDGSHHAYKQAENDDVFVMPVIVNPGGRIFRCNPWMASQAHEFIDLIRYLGNEIQIQVKGDGLLSHILEVGAEQADIQEKEN